MGIRKMAQRLVPAAIAVQILMAVPKLKRSRSDCMMKGHAVPTTFLEERTTPYARARLLMENHSLSARVVGLYRRAQPKAARTPCVATSCHTCVLKEESRKPAQLRTMPPRAVVRRKRAHRRLSAAKRKGIDRYMTPLEVVPMTPTPSRLPFSDQWLR